MTPEQLNASILQYAIQGKLVEQRPEEGTGEELYRQIQAEKQRLIKEGKIKKEKALPEISEDEFPFEIPESWRWVRWGDLSQSIQYGYNAPAQDVGRIKMVRISDIQDGKVLWDTVPYCEIREEEIPTYLLQKNDILFARTGGTVGKSYLVKDVPEESIYAGYLIRTRYSSLLCPEYMKYFMESLLYWDQLRNGTIATAQPNCNGKTLSKMILPLPPLAEQKRIVAKIEELLPYVDRYAAAYEKLEQFNAKFPEDMKKSILQYAIQGKLVEQRPEEGTGKELYRQIQAEKQRLIKTGKLKKTRALPTITGEEVPYDFPASWKVCYIDDIAFVTKLAGFEYTKYISDNLVPTGIPLFKGKNVQNGKLVLSFESYIPESVSDELPRSQITKKCLLTPYVGTIGNIAVFDGSFKAHLGSNVGKIELLNSDTQTFILEEYVLWYLKSTYGYAELTKYKKATAQESISIDAIRNVVIAIPPLEEQRRIVAKLEEILPLCERLK